MSYLPLVNLDQIQTLLANEKFWNSEILKFWNSDETKGKAWDTSSKLCTNFVTEQKFASLRPRTFDCENFQPQQRTQNAKSKNLPRRWVEKRRRCGKFSSRIFWNKFYNTSPVDSLRWEQLYNPIYLSIRFLAIRINCKPNTLFTGSSMTVLNQVIFVLWIVVSVLAAGAIGMTLYFFVDIFVPNHTKD